MAQVQSVRTDTADMKYDTFVITEPAAHLPASGSHVADTGLHQVNTAMSVTTAAIAVNVMTEYRIQRYVLHGVTRMRATQIDALIGTVDMTDRSGELLYRL